MKKTILGCLFLAICMAISNGCQKDSNISKQNLDSSDFSHTKPKPVIGSKDLVIVRCDQRRKRYGCDSGWGICNCEWFPDAPWKTMQSTLNPTSNEMTLICDDWANNGESILYVDEDIILPQSVANEHGYSSIKIKEGEYTKVSSTSVTVNVVLN